MSYTLRGRLESRLAVSLLPFLAAAVAALALRAWWPVEVAALMIGVGLALDVAVLHRLLPYQPGWLALPLGLVELAATMGLVRLLDVGAPLRPALALFAGAWLAGQVLTHAVLPLVHLSYAEEGGELGIGGTALRAAAPAVLLLVLCVAWATQPPIVRLAAGVHEGPLLLDHSQRLIGKPGAVVRGGIVITSDDVEVRNVKVVGGEHGIEVDDAEDVLIDGVIVEGAELDGIHVRRGVVTIRDCVIRSLPNSYAQGIDISFGGDLRPSLVERCTVTGGLEGIVTHFSLVRVRQNRVIGTELRGITMTEMSMGSVEENIVSDAVGVGIFCGDYSHCDIEDNEVSGIRPDERSDDATRQGVAIQAHFGAIATLGDDNRVARSPGGIRAFTDATIERD